ncbi:hypothetical protein VitviT2T_021346 [Vitis vinifera]|uniref:RNase H type-1 domain-containing protein n=1 Tax=Vitis vinifera TaxID=29760 RepID=A0ABY9D884_VITVI|nr:hypothetical protein VitviT2T_021346 [Vitis vinifera]
MEMGISPVVLESEHVDLPLSFDVLSGFVSHSDDDIFDIDDEIVHYNLDEDSSSTSDSSPSDQRVSPTIGDAEIVDFGTADQPRELRIGLDLSTDERDDLIQLLISYLDVFAWSYEDMSGLDPSIVKEEFQKQLSVGLLLVVEYPEWLVNVVPVPKNDGKVRVCVDFRDLNKILMAPEDMEKTSFITEWGTYCYRVMPFGLKNARVTYQRAATTIFHDIMHQDVKLDDLGKERVIYYLSKRMLDYETRYVMIERFCLPLVWATQRLRHYMTKYSMHLISRLDPLRYLFDKPALIDRLMRWLVLLTKFDIHYATQKSIKWRIVANHLALLLVSDGRAIDDDFLDEDIVVVTSLSDWRMYFDGAANHSRYRIGVLLISPHGDHIPRSVRLAFSDRHPAMNNIVEYEACILGLKITLELEIRQMEVFGDSNLVLRQIQGQLKARNVKLKPYHAYLNLVVGRFDDLSYTHLPRTQNQFADALATLPSMIDIPANTIVRPLLIESRLVPTYCCLIDEAELDDGLPWYHDIYKFFRLGIYPEVAIAKDKRALRQLATRFMIYGETLYKRSANGMLLLCLHRASADREMREVHAGVCGPHMR